MKDENFCVLPFVGMCIEGSGRHKTCCKYEKWNNTSVYESSISTVFNSKDYESIRNDFLLGKKHEGCKRCWDDESVGVTSMRQTANKKYLNGRQPDILYKSKAIEVLDFGFGNTCNAACITCESSSSQKWSKDDLYLRSIKGNPFGRLHFEAQESSFKWSEKELSKLNHLIFAQNEVLATNEFFEFITYLDKKTDISEKSIFISTNSSVWPKDKILKILSKFKKFNLQISIDGMGKINDYIRYPLKSEKTHTIATKWVSYSKKNKSVKISLRTTISTYNVLDLLPIVEWWREISGGAHHSFGYCWFPHYLDPIVFKDSYLDELKRQSKKLKALNKIIKSKKIKDKVMDKDTFWNFTHIMDKRRGLSFKELGTKSYEYIKDTEKNEPAI